MGILDKDWWTNDFIMFRGFDGLIKEALDGITSSSYYCFEFNSLNNEKAIPFPRFDHYVSSHYRAIRNRNLYRS